MSSFAINLWRACLLLGFALVSAPVETRPLTAVAKASLVATFPHDRGAFTEGLFFQDGFLYESTGGVGRSSIRRVDLRNGRVLARRNIAPPYFGEGIVAIGAQIISLTWQDQLGFRWSLKEFKPIGRFTYQGEGWGLTHDGRHVIMSDGTASLRFLNPDSLVEVHRMTATADGIPVAELNELEYVDGEILANVWRTDRIARIDPVTGKVTGWIDVSALTAKARPINADAVPNGIAWDRAQRRLFVTGKNWPFLFQIKPPKD